VGPKGDCEAPQLVRPLRTTTEIGIFTAQRFHTDVARILSISSAILFTLTLLSSKFYYCIRYISTVCLGKLDGDVSQFIPSLSPVLMLNLIHFNFLKMRLLLKNEEEQKLVFFVGNISYISE